MKWHVYTHAISKSWARLGSSMNAEHWCFPCLVFIKFWVVHVITEATHYAGIWYTQGKSKSVSFLLFITSLYVLQNRIGIGSDGNCVVCALTIDILGGYKSSKYYRYVKREICRLSDLRHPACIPTVKLYKWWDNFSWRCTISKSHFW